MALEDLKLAEEAEKAAKLETLTQEFLINKDIEETNMTLDFAKALLALDLEIKDLKTDQKEIKKDAKANGVSVQKVTKALNLLKSVAKSNDMDLLELETIESVLGNDVDIKTQIAELVKKD
jgi:uncharacterized protein (UPF0335 family)